VSAQWLQVSQRVFEKKMQEIRGTWQDFETSSPSSWCIGQRTAYDVEWKALLKCSRQLLLMRYSIENRLGYNDSVEMAKLKHDFKHDLKMKEE